MAALRIGLMLMLCACSCSAVSLQVWNCSEQYPVRQPCTLKCCGQGSSSLTPVATYIDKSDQDIFKTASDFTVPACRFTDAAKGKFECVTTRNGSCYTDNYTCQVTQGRYKATAIIGADFPHGEATDGITCLPPLITQFDATKLSSAVRGKLNVSLSWRYTHDQSYPYCDGSRQFHVAYTQYTNYQEALNDKSYLYVNQEYKFVSRRVTNHTLYLLSVDNYFRFFIRTPEGLNSTRFNSAVVSKLKHFRNSVPISFEVASSEHYVREGDRLTITCEASGWPRPNVTYWKVDTNHPMTSLQFDKVHLGDEGLYICRACHDVFNNERGRAEAVCSSANRRLFVTPIQNDRNCIAYTMGTQCYEYIYSNWKVYSDNTTLLSEASISSVVEISHQFTRRCRLFIKSVLCHLLFPYCDPFTIDVGGYSPLPVCPVTCANVEQECGKDIDKFGGEFSGFLRERCERDVDRWGESGPGDKPGCIYVDPDHPLKGGPDADTVSTANATTKCILGNGRNYRGDETFTESGLPCQRWSLDWPNPHEMDRMMGGELDTASKYCRNPGGLGERPWCFVGSGTNPRWDYCDIPNCEQCVPYDGEFCSAVGYTADTSVFFRRQVKDSISDMELELRGLLHVMQDSPREGEELTAGCELVAHQLLCIGALPTCKDREKLVLCEQHCLLLDMLTVCPSALKTVIFSIGYLNDSLSVCSSRSLLPPPTSALCLPPPTFMVGTNTTTTGNNKTSSGDCHEEDDQGLMYAGNVSVTVTLSPCLPWSRVLHGGWVQAFPELSGSYCRNPGQLGQRPWCFTSVNGSWEYCNISLCSNSPPSVQTVVDVASDNQDTVAAILGVGFFVVLLVVALGLSIAAFLYYKHNRQHSRTLKGITDVVPFSANSLYSNEFLGLPVVSAETDSFRKIERSKIKYVKEIGRGNFGIVFQGECDWINQEDRDGPTKVAVKTLKQESKKEAIEDFVSEAKILHKFDHPNIVRFYGVCMETLPFYLVFEYMEQGDLCQYLRSRSSSAQRRYSPPAYRERISSTVSTDSATLGTSELLDICRQICHGMVYLESQNHVHRDLACRNCLVGAGMIVKIADFGMSKNLYSKDYYRVSGEASLPVRWMPPESILYGTFSTRADVWSFGVVVWEVFSFGLQPYFGQPNDTVVELVRKGKLLEKPESCPDKIYSLVKAGCWGMEDFERTTFATLDRSLENLRLSDSDMSGSGDDSSLGDVFEEDYTLTNTNDDDKED